MSAKTWWFFGAMLVYTVLCRLLPYLLDVAGVLEVTNQQPWFPWNFSPVMALCLFGGACLNPRWVAFAVPLGALILSDLGILALTGRPEWVFTTGRLFILGLFAGAIGLGHVLRGRPQVATAIPVAILAECVFFVLSNLGVWYFGDGTLYPRTADGLMMCYIAAIPFFGRSVVSTLLFALICFSPFGLRAAGITSTAPSVHTNPIAA